MQIDVKAEVDEVIRALGKLDGEILSRHFTILPALVIG